MQAIDTTVRVAQTSPAPSVQVTDGETHLYYESCEESKNIVLTDSAAEDSGRTLDMTLTLQNVCPGKRVAVGVRLTEVDANGVEYPRAFHAETVPAHNQASCANITLSTLRFVMPEDISVGSGVTPCPGRRHFILRTITHYVDTNATATAAAAC